MMARLKRERPEPRAKVIQFRATATEAEWLRAEAAKRGMRVADLLREALDAYLAKGAKATGRP